MRRLISLMRWRLLRWPMLIAVLLVTAVLLIDQRVHRGSAPYLHDASQSLPPRHVALVLGTSPTLRDGRVNPWFRHRIEAASALFLAGKAEHVLVSGDNGRREYNEPMAMRAALIAAGVDSTRITLDYAGFDTFDSVVRARKVFSARDLVIVSQRSHNERAVCIARHFGIDAVALNAGTSYGGTLGMLREKAARLKMMWEFLTGAEPHFLGEPVKLGGQAIPE